jgi:hypothetical protein
MNKTLFAVLKPAFEDVIVKIWKAGSENAPGAPCKKDSNHAAVSGLIISSNAELPTKILGQFSALPIFDRIDAGFA